jgi:hypothetical protein
MIGKLELWWATLRDLIGAHPELLGVALAMFAVAGFVLIRVFPGKSDLFASWIRISRYCHSCPHIDLLTEDCAIGAKFGEKCGLIDKTAGMAFTVTKNT